MSDNKKYYYFRLKESFFESESMIILEGMPDGFLYSNILLKLYAKSLKGEGRLMVTERIPYNATTLAQVTRHQVGTVERAMRVFEELGLIEVLDNGAIYISDIQAFIGKTSTEADRIREYQRRISAEKSGVPLIEGEAYISTPEIESETKYKEQRTELNPDKDTFAQFWAAYPKKVAKVAAESAWDKLNPDSELLEKMLAALEQSKKCADWTKEDGKYIPYPSTWLNQRRWEDDCGDDDPINWDEVKM